MNGLLKIILAVMLFGLGLTFARAQIYLANPNSGVVSEFDADKGEIVHGFGITDLVKPRGIFLSEGYLYVVEAGESIESGSIGVYDAKTGAPINRRLVTNLISPMSVAVSGQDLFVTALSDHGGSGVGKYNARTGAEVKASFIGPIREAFDIALANDKLFVGGPNSVAEFDAKTGAVINARFIGRIGAAAGLAIQGDHLWAVQGAPVPYGCVWKYSLSTGLSETAFPYPLIKGLDRPATIAVSGDALYVVNVLGGFVGKYDARTGAVINEKFISGLTRDVFGIAAVPSEATGGYDLSTAQFDVKNWFFDAYFYLHFHPIYSYFIVGFIGILVIAVLVAIGLRVQAGREKSANRTQSSLEEVFAGAPERVVLGSFALPPTTGCLITSESEQFEWVSVHRGDIIAALDGYRVDTTEQFGAIRAVSSNPRMNLILWRQDHYIEVQVTSRGRKFPMQLENFQG